MSLKLLRAKLNEDPAFAALQEMTATAKRSINSERVIAEATTLHTGRTSKDLYKVALQPTPMYKAIADDLSARSRITTMKVSIMREAAILERAVSKMKKHITAKYPEELKSWSTQAQRVAVIDRLLAPAKDIVDDLTSCMDILDTLTKDIDQANFSMGRSVDILKLLIERKDQVV